jgi:hypothetical protein
MRWLVWGWGPMQDNLEDIAKLRLTERHDIETAIEVLKSYGFELEQIITELVRVFYVDLDEFNDLLKAA